MTSRLPLRLLLIALAAAFAAVALAFVAYVLLLPDFVQRTPTGSVEPDWLFPASLGVALGLGGFVAQRCLLWRTEHEGQLGPSVALGVLMGALVNLAWSARLLATEASLTDVVQAWSFLPLASALGGALIGHVSSRLFVTRKY